MTLLWESDAMLAAMNGRPVGQLPDGISGISIDTRSLQPGEAYFAIKGDRVDGHDYVSAAMKAGAGLAVVCEEKLVALGGLNLPLIVVNDVLRAMELLAEASRARTKARIVAVTGSVGKTTTKEMLRTVLEASGKVHASVASFNNHWGVPLTLARMPADTRFGVFEIGMNHPDEIRPLVKLVRPHIAVITNVAAVHLGAFDSVDEIAKAKAEIFEGVEDGGHGIIPRDDERYELLVELSQAAGIQSLKSFGGQRGASFKLISATPAGEGYDYTVSINGDVCNGRLNVSGAHLVQNMLAVLGIAALMGADIKTSIEAGKNIGAVKGRGKRHTLKIGDGAALLIDESYNANPASMRAAIASLAATQTGQGGKRIAVLGDMLELGSHSDDLHRGLGELIDEFKIDQVFSIGDEISVLSQALNEGIHAGHYARWQDGVKEIEESLKVGDVVMLKASNGLKFGELVEALIENHAANLT